MKSNLLSWNRFDAVLFDLDGVLTATATLHAACWKRIFDEHLRMRGRKTGELFLPFEAEYIGVSIGGYDDLWTYLEYKALASSEATIFSLVAVVMGTVLVFWIRRSL